MAGTWSEWAQGYEITDKDFNFIKCPKDKTNYIVYNGNYFCSEYAKGGCNWAMPHPVTKKRDQKICDLLGLDYG
jgi:hypothetical protein